MPRKFEESEIEAAYIKLRSYIYYDNTDILLRRKLVEFESNTTKDFFSSFMHTVEEVYENDEFFDMETGEFSSALSVAYKLKMITNGINSFQKDPSFFDYFLSKIGADFYPKKIKEDRREINFITNKRVQKEYELEKLTAFIDAPIELHLISVLWSIHFGVEIDQSLSDSSYGNRLLLNKDKQNLIQGSGLFKPYYKQYQKWRDESITVAQNLLKKNKNVLFLNLDVQDFFHSVRIPISKFAYSNKKNHTCLDNLKAIMLRLHQSYTRLIIDNYGHSHNIDESKTNNQAFDEEKFLLPIGLLSSYILANDYLRAFDKRIEQKIKPAYYGRYVDDILLVISDPSFDYEIDKLEGIEFSFLNYKKGIEDLGDENVKISYDEKDLNQLESFVLRNLHPVLNLIDTPNRMLKHTDKIKALGAGVIDPSLSPRVFKLNGYDSLYCNPEKSLVYVFDHNESDLVVDKLKKELNERTSEFRDFPEEGENENSFEESAYHLLYDGSEGKIKTLKDYKEDRYGLTVYLANKIFSSLRHDKPSNDDENDQVLKFFRGLICIDFYRLWEKIFTFFLVNKRPLAYTSFYLHCLEQIDKISITSDLPGINKEKIRHTLREYLDCANEIVLSLNPNFIRNNKKIERHFEFGLARLTPFFQASFETTVSNSHWLSRFRATNMIRQHYVIHPLLSFTYISSRSQHDLTKIDFPMDEFKLDSELVINSPRPIKFYECCMAIAYDNIASHKLGNTKGVENCVTDILGIYEVKPTKSLDAFEESFYLEDAFDLYRKLNKKHSADYILNNPDLKNEFFNRRTDEIKYNPEDPILLQEINIPSFVHINNPKIAFVNTKVYEANIKDSIRGKPNHSVERYSKLAKILKSARNERADLLLFPESFIPYSLLSSIVRYSEKNNCATFTGLEHITVDSTSFNFIVSILPVQVNGINDAVVVFRLKNHYSHSEESLIVGNHCLIPKPEKIRYDIFNWKNIYLAPMYCFELANSRHRSLFMGKIDLLIGVEWNRDLPYFSNIMEASARDLHAYVAQVNTSHFGDTRLIQPKESAVKDILRLKGGTNDAILIGNIDIGSLREFQREKYSLTSIKKEFKPLPPNFVVANVLKRINNKWVLK